MEKTLDSGEQSASRLGSDSRSTTYGGGSSGCSVTPLPCGTVSVLLAPNAEHRKAGWRSRVCEAKTEPASSRHSV